MPGYRLASSEQKRIGPKYMCNLCGLLLRDPVQTACGHFYCLSCVGNLFLNGSSKMTCVQDSTELTYTEVFRDNFMCREVQSFVVCCTFLDDGCEWKGEVRHLENHVSRCGSIYLSCVYPDCAALVKKADLHVHLEKECKCRPETCRFCKSQISINKMQLHHQQECLAYPTVCEGCNRDGIPRGKLFHHQDPVMGDCDGILGPCPFSQIGCPNTEVRSQKQKKEHLAQENTYHTTLILQHALRVSREVEALLMHDPRIVSRNPHIFTNYDGVIADILAQVQTQAGETRDLREKCREHSKRITALERKVASGNLSGGATSVHAPGDSSGGSHNPEDFTRKVTNLEERTADHGVLLVENCCSMGEARLDMCNVKRQLDTNQESVRRQERRIESIEHTLALRNVTLADLEEYVRQQEFSSYDGQLLWKISDYTRRRNDAVTGQQVSIYSSCFYTSRYGYKLRARVYLDGNGVGRGTHMSVFFVVMRGPYDALLRWPFGGRVTFMLLDQDNLNHVISAFRPHPYSCSFQRPRRETNIAIGYPLFCSLVQLNNHAYVRDNSMFLKIIVEPD